MRHLRRTALLAASVLALLSGCQHASAPTDPTAAAQLPGFAATALSDPATVGLAAGVLSIDRDAGTAEFLPVRGSTAIGDTFSELGLAPAFTEMFGTNFRVVGLRKTGPTTVEVDFEITHPFPAATRPDLAVFNLKAWIVSDEPATPFGPQSAVAGFVTNADGYGQMWSTTADALPTFATADLQPYVILNEDPSSAPFNWQNPAGFNVFFPGQSSIDTVGLDLGPATQTSVRLFITGDYGQSAVRATRQTPAYELPEFAGNAAWKIAVTELDNALEAGLMSSSASYKVDIWDWKHGQGLGSDVAAVTLQIPGITTAPLSLSLSGSGQDPTPLTSSVLVTNAENAIEGDYWGLVTVTDAATSGIGLKEDLVTPVSILNYTTWQLFPVAVGEVSVPLDPPTAILERDCPGQPLALGAQATFEGINSLEGGAPIVDYEWDFDYDGVAFNIEATGSQVMQPWPTLGTFTVALRVRDANAETDLATTLVTVLPAATWGAPIRLTNTPARELFDTSQNTSNGLSVGPDGRVHLVWMTQLPYEIIYQSFLPGPSRQTWDAPVVLYSSGGGALGHVSCQTGPDNVTHVMYGQNSAGRPRYSVHNSGGIWSTPAMVPTPTDPGVWDRTLMIGGSDGTMAFAGQWSRGDQPPNGSGLPALPNDVYFSRLIGNVWEPITLVGGADVVTSGGGGGRVPSHALIGTAAGEWIVVWENLYTPYTGGASVPSLCKLVWNQTTSGSWGTGADLYSDGVDYDLPILARSPNGRIWLGARIGTTDAWGLATYADDLWSPALAQIFDPTGVQFSRLPVTQFAFDAAGRGCVLVAYREPTAPVQAKFFLQDDAPLTLAACAPQVIEPGITGVGKPMCQIAQHGDGRFTGIWLTTKYNPGFPYTADTEIEYATFE